MSTIFAQTIARAISDYRTFLRKSMQQSDRVRKLHELNLKDPEIYNDEVKLFQIATSIIKDIEENVKIPDQNYYSYSGIAKFCGYLKEYLNHYDVEDNKVIHKAQKASRALLQSIQLLSLAQHQLDEQVARKLDAYNEVIAAFGSDEQLELHMATLERQQSIHGEFYTPIIDKFKKHLDLRKDEN